MLQSLRRVIWPGGVFTGSHLEHRRSLLLHMLLLMGACGLPFYFIQHAGPHPVAVLVGTLGFWVLLVAVRLRTSIGCVAHSALSWSIACLSYGAVVTGGIHSSLMVWITVMALPAMLLFDRLCASLWLFVVLLIPLLLFLATQAGLLDGATPTTEEVMVGAIVNGSFAMIFVVILWLITERMHRRQMMAMDESNTELERTHQALTRVLTHKDESMASVGHELRTPMNAILGLNGLIRTELANRPQDVAVVDYIRQATEQLLQVVNDLLDFSQLQAGRFTFREDAFAVREVAELVLQAHEKKAQAKNIALILGAMPAHTLRVKGDRQRLIQILNHLLDNAIKFTSQGEVMLRIQTVADGLLFEVHDTGVGIAPNRQSEIFKGFEQASWQTNRPHDGVGLGLPICESLVTMQGGSFGVNSAVGRGACFWFQLPLRTVTMEETHAGVDASLPLVDQPFQLLLVDDNPVNLLVARMMLNQCFPQASVTQASSGANALERLRAHRFDVVLMDMLMPEMDGMAVTRVVRQELANPMCDVPVVGLTASTDPRDREQCLASGMNDVLYKPLEQAQLISKISSVLLAHAKGRHP